MTSFRDNVRLRYPRALAFYQRRVAPLITRDRRHHELSEWARKGPEIVEKTGMHGIRFERDGIWVDDGHGFLWAYTPGMFGSALGAEFGVQYEHTEIETLAERVAGGGFLVDVGANMGLHSVQLAKTVDNLKVLALEPVAYTFEVLRRNIAKNGASDSVEAVRMAVGEEDGVLRLTNTLQLGNFVVPEGVSTASGITEEVPARRLDDVVAERGEKVTAIKCDVEGAELGVLRGATQTIERDRPIALMEIDERWAARYGHTGADVVSFFTDRDYRYERIVGEKVLPPSGSLETDLAEGQNFLFSPA